MTTDKDTPLVSDNEITPEKVREWLGIFIRAYLKKCEELAEMTKQNDALFHQISLERTARRWNWFQEKIQSLQKAVGDKCEELELQKTVNKMTAGFADENECMALKSEQRRRELDQENQRLQSVIDKQHKVLGEVMKIAGDEGYTKGRQTIYVIVKEALALTAEKGE